MKRLLLLVFVLVVLASPAWAGGLLIGSGVTSAPPEWTSVDYTTFELESDTHNQFSYTSSTITYANFSRYYFTYLAKDYGVDHFNGDFSVRFVFNQSAADTAFSTVIAFSMGNYLESYAKSISNGHDKVLFITYGKTPAVFRLAVVANGTNSEVSSSGLTYGTDYYVTIERDDDGGANGTGQYVATIRTGSHTGTVFATLTMDCPAGEQNDYRYLFGIASNINAGGVDQADGYISNLEIK